MRRLLAVAVVLVLLAVGTFLGSAVSQYDRSGGEVTPPGPPGGMRVRVEVLNGGGVAGVAGRATDVLRELGFDVVFYGNAQESGQNTSRVVDRVGRLDAARSVADALGIRSVRSEPDSNLYLDVTVVLGTDWTPGGEGMGSSEHTRSKWDPRGWLSRPGNLP